MKRDAELGDIAAEYGSDFTDEELQDAQELEEEEMAGSTRPTPKGGRTMAPAAGDSSPDPGERKKSRGSSRQKSDDDGAASARSSRSGKSEKDSARSVRNTCLFGFEDSHDTNCVVVVVVVVFYGSTSRLSRNYGVMLLCCSQCSCRKGFALQVQCVMLYTRDVVVHRSKRSPHRVFLSSPGKEGEERKEREKGEEGEKREEKK